MTDEYEETLQRDRLIRQVERKKLLKQLASLEAKHRRSELYIILASSLIGAVFGYLLFMAIGR